MLGISYLPLAYEKIVCERYFILRMTQTIRKGAKTLTPDLLAPNLLRWKFPRKSNSGFCQGNLEPKSQYLKWTPHNPYIIRQSYTVMAKQWLYEEKWSATKRDINPKEQGQSTSWLLPLPRPIPISHMLHYKAYSKVWTY